METKKKVWMVTTGTGQDGDEWNVQSVHATVDGANLAKAEYEKPQKRSDGSSYVLEATIEEWPLED